MNGPEQREVAALHARMCQALADPKRLLLIYALNEGPKSVGELGAELGLSQTNVSQHLSILRDRGVVIATRSGTSVIYRLRSADVVTALDLLRNCMREAAVAAVAD